ncbi:MAG: ATP-binding protein [Gemmataceae bacterium]|nr:ATP-binding protein [Gemmataceae bacterium]
MEVVTRQFVSDLTELGPIRAFVREACARAWGPGHDEALNRLELALSEAVANIMLHAYRREPGQPIEVTVTTALDHVGVTIFHEGEGFDPDAVQPPVFDAGRESGFGVYLIRQSVDEVEFLRDDTGRHGVRLVKKRH